METSDALRRLLPGPAYPAAAWPYPSGSRLVRVSCKHCGEECGVSKWDRWNGFLSVCPRCGSIIGRRWNLRAVLWGSVALNAVSFLFTMRPRRSVSTILRHRPSAFSEQPR